MPEEIITPTEEVTTPVAEAMETIAETVATETTPEVVVETAPIAEVAA